MRARGSVSPGIVPGGPAGGIGGIRLSLSLLVSLVLAPSPDAAAQTAPAPRVLTTVVAAHPPDHAMRFDLDLAVRALGPRDAISGVYLAYGQRARWDIDNDELPFRVESNHRPEIGLLLGGGAGRSLVSGWPRALAISIAFVHESNGLEKELSRGWNRVAITCRLGSPSDPVHGALTVWHGFRLDSANTDLRRYAGDGEIALGLAPGRATRSGTRVRVEMRSRFGTDTRDGGIFTNLDTRVFLRPDFLPGWLFPDRSVADAALLVSWFVGKGEMLFHYREYRNELRVGLAVALGGSVP